VECALYERGTHLDRAFSHPSWAIQGSFRGGNDPIVINHINNTVPTVKIDPTIILTQLSAGFFFDPYNLIGSLMQGKD
jgi:hypothetical protein